MKKRDTRYGLGIISLAVMGVAVFALMQTTNKQTSNQGRENTSISQQQSSDLVNLQSSDYKRFSQLNGDEYDRVFIANMIEHHKGAVDMAKLALGNAKHQELKDMANQIISDQSQEIEDMTKWQKQWSYPSSSGEMMMDHSAMGMTGVMAGMTDSLRGLSGDGFDEAFLAGMIQHHQSAIDMSYPGQTNAKHSEVKALTQAIVVAQSKEITQMKQWQKAWKYNPASNAMEGMSH